jgi:GxxExxY protein
MLLHEETSMAIIGAAIEVHRILGPGLLEQAYEECLCRELQLRKIAFERQVWLAIEYKGITVPNAYRIDLLVDDKVVVELKTVETFDSIHEAQLLTYLRLSGKQVGLMINFRVGVLKNGILRRVLQ